MPVSELFSGWPAWAVFVVLALGAYARGSVTYWLGRGARVGSERSRWRRYAEAPIVGSAERVFGRTWGGEAGGPHAGRRKETSDTRIRGVYDETIALDVAPSAISRLRWSLVYERVIAMRGGDVELASSDVVAEGEVAW